MNTGSCYSRVNNEVQRGMNIRDLTRLVKVNEKMNALLQEDSDVCS